MELVVCAVHPIPGKFFFLWTTKLSNHGGKIGSQVIYFCLYLLIERSQENKLEQFKKVAKGSAGEYQEWV